MRFVLVWMAACACGGRVTDVDAGVVDAAVVPDSAPTDALEGAAPCLAPNITCDGACVSSNAMHCGPSCAQCPATAAFAHAVCNDGTCGTACDVLECSGVCTGPSDATNCGECGRSCGGQSCNASICAPETLATASVFGFDVDDSNVYYSDLGGTLWVVPVAGGTPASLGNVGAEAVALDATYVYWDTGTYGLARMPLGGGAVTELASSGVPDFVLADTMIYGGQAAKIWQLPIDGGSVQPFASTIHFTGLAPDATDLYVTGEGIVRLSRADASATTLLASTESVEAATSDLTTLFYATYETNGYAIHSMSKASPTTPTLIANVTTVSEMAVDATNVYFSNGTTVSRVAKTGGAVHILSAASYPVRRMAINATHVFFSDGFTLMRTPK